MRRASPLRKLLRPQSVAVVGAGNTPGKIGATVVANLLEHGFAGTLYPVNPKHSKIQGLDAYPNLESLPTPPDLVLLATPATGVPELIRSCGRLQVGAAIVLAAGFGETGEAGKALEQQLRQARSEYPALRVLGPNCLGVIVPSAKLNASFGQGMPPAGRVALLSQSGALCTAILDRAILENVGFSAMVSVGNMLDIGFHDLLDYFATDPETDAAVLYVESITDAREFMSAARAFSTLKPIVAYKAGRFQQSAQAAASHTGAMAGVDAVYDAAFRRAGIVRVVDFEELFDTAELLSRSRRPIGPKLAILTNAGGPGIMAVDALIAGGGVVGELTQQTRSALDGALPPAWSHHNPIDVLGDAPAERYAAALDIVVKDPGVDGVLALLTPQAMTDPTATAEAVIASTSGLTKPVLAAWMGGELVNEGRKRLEAAGVPTYSTPERAVRAFLHLTEYAERRELLTETPRLVPLEFSSDSQQLGERFRERLATNPAWLNEEDSKSVLETYGIATARSIFAATAKEAAAIARQIGGTVVLKVSSPEITHKTEVDGVRLRLQGDAEVMAAFEQIVASAELRRPDATVAGVTVEPMIDVSNGLELILGLRRDPVFGPVLMIGLGGVATEVLGDRVLELPPLDERSAQRMIDSLRCRPLLYGHRGRPRLAVDRLLEVLLRFSRLAADRPEIAEADVNPLLVTADGVVALDARFRLETWNFDGKLSRRRRSHLAIAPYPGHLIRSMSIAGTPIVLRPIRPEDEPQWLAFLSACSAETVHHRFGGLLAAATHASAVRYCYVDYDREVAFVAEIEGEGGRRIVGVGRVVCDPDRRQAELAVLVADAWQRKGLGGVLTDACLNCARELQADEVVAVTTADNQAMLQILKRCGFHCALSDDGHIDASCLLR